MPAIPHPLSHPRRGDRFGSILAQWSLLSLLAAFLGLLPGRVWAYVGTPVGRRRHARGVAPAPRS
jgi:hypothetical protein